MIVSSVEKIDKVKNLKYYRIINKKWIKPKKQNTKEFFQLRLENDQYFV